MIFEHGAKASGFLRAHSLSRRPHILFSCLGSRQVNGRIETSAFETGIGGCDYVWFSALNRLASLLFFGDYFFYLSEVCFKRNLDNVFGMHSQKSSNFDECNKKDVFSLLQTVGVTLVEANIGVQIFLRVASFFPHRPNAQSYLLQKQLDGRACGHTNEIPLP